MLDFEAKLYFLGSDSHKELYTNFGSILGLGLTCLKVWNCEFFKPLYEFLLCVLSKIEPKDTNWAQCETELKSPRNNLNIQKVSS